MTPLTCIHITHAAIYFPKYSREKDNSEEFSHIMAGFLNITHVAIKSKNKTQQQQKKQNKTSICVLVKPSPSEITK